MAIRIWGEEDDDDVRLRLVKGEQAVALVACDNSGKERFRLATIAEKGIYLWTGLGAGFPSGSMSNNRSRLIPQSFPRIRPLPSMS